MAWTWRTITDDECDANSPIKTRLVLASYYNLLAAAEGSGAAHTALAPYLQGTGIKTNDLDGSKVVDATLGGSYIDPLPTAKFADGIVNQSDCSVSNQELGGAYADPISGVNITFNDQAFYLLGYGMRGTSGNYFNAWLGCGDSPLIANNQVDGVNFTTFKTFGYATQISVPSGSRYCYFKVYYFNASPPYDIGHGETAGFVYAKVNSKGEVIGTSISADPPWYCSPRASQVVMRDGKNFFRRRRGPTEWQTPTGWAARLESIRNPVYDEILIDNDFKNANMDRCPCPGIGGMEHGDTMVLIEPSGDMAAEIMDLYRAGDDPSGLLQRGDIKIKSAIAGHKAPRGVVPVRAVWR